MCGQMTRQNLVFHRTHEEKQSVSSGSFFFTFQLTTRILQILTGHATHFCGRFNQCAVNFTIPYTYSSYLVLSVTSTLHFGLPTISLSYGVWELKHMVASKLFHLYVVDEYVTIC